MKRLELRAGEEPEQLHRPEKLGADGRKSKGLQEFAASRSNATTQLRPGGGDAHGVQGATKQQTYENQKSGHAVNIRGTRTAGSC